MPSVPITRWWPKRWWAALLTLCALSAFEGCSRVRQFQRATGTGTELRIANGTQHAIDNLRLQMPTQIVEVGHLAAGEIQVVHLSTQIADDKWDPRLTGTYDDGRPVLQPSGSRPDSKARLHRVSCTFRDKDTWISVVVEI